MLFNYSCLKLEIYNSKFVGFQLSSCKAEGEGSVVAEVGSEHCDSDGHDTDLENGDELKGQNTDQIEVLKGIFYCCQHY